MVTSSFSVDDGDPSIIYLGVWGQLNDHLAYNTTLTWLSYAATAKIPFVGELFNAFQTPLPHPTKGSSIGVYGTNWANSPHRKPAPACLYTIDEGTPVRLTSDRTATTKWGDLFFQSPDLPKTSHVLTIEYADDSKTKDAISLDFFIVNDDTLPSDPSSPLTISFPSSMTTTPFTTPHSPVLSLSSFSTLESSSGSSSPTSGAMHTRPATELVQGKTTPKLPIGPIIGGALGALTFICAILLLLYLRRRRRESHSDKNIGAPPLVVGKNSQFLS
jgi:hypothetical protein